MEFGREPLTLGSWDG